MEIATTRVPRWFVETLMVCLGWGTVAPLAIGHMMQAILFFYVDWQERRKV